MTASDAGGLGANYRRLWASSAAANLADGVFVVALPLLAVTLTTSPALIAGVAIAGRLPWLVFVLFAGVLADRLDRRVTMRNVQVIRVAVIGGLAVLVLVDGLSLPMLYVVAFVLGVGETLFDTAAQSVLPNIVPRERLNVANGRLYAVELVMNQFVGPPLGGFLVALSMVAALAGSALAYALAALGLALMVGTFRATRTAPPTSVLQDIREGMGYLLGHTVLRTLAIMVAVANLAAAASWAIFVVFAVAPGPMGLDAFGYGVLMTGMAIGAIVGTLTEPFAERSLGRSRTLFTTVILTAAALAAPALSADPVIVFAAMALSGVMMTWWNIITVSLRQRITPDELLGRVNAGYRLLAWGTMPIGALLGGLLAQVLSVEAVFLAAGLGSLAMLVFRGVITDAALDAAELPVTAGATDSMA